MFERGEMALFPFYDQFGRELSDTKVNNPAYVSYCERRGLGMTSPRTPGPHPCRSLTSVMWFCPSSFFLFSPSTTVVA